MPRKPLDLSTGVKRCPKCEETKPLDQFFKSSGTVHGYSVYCKICNTTRHDAYRRQNLPKMREASKKWRIENPELAKDHSRKSNYGIALGEYDRLLATQQGKCAICESPEAGGRGAFHVDHCHETGRVRGLLCHNCNVGIGHFKHDPNLLENAKCYLSRT